MSHCFALVDIIPPYSLSPSLNNLNVNYFVKQDKIKIALYAVNHEAFPVVCDAEYQGGPDTEHASEQIIMPEKAIEFSFVYPKKIKNVILQFACIKKADIENNNTTETPKTKSVIETELSTPK